MRLSTLLIACMGITCAPDSGPGASPPTDRTSKRDARTVIEPVIVMKGTFLFGGMYLTPPCTLSYRDDVLVVNGLRLRQPQPPKRGPVRPSTSAKEKHRLSEQAGRVASEAREDGCSDPEIYARLARFYRTSELVDSVDVGPGHLVLTYRDRSASREHILLPRPSSLSPEERRERRATERERELIFLKRVLEEGGVVLRTPTGGVTIPWHRAGAALQAIEAYRQQGRTQGLAEFVRSDLWPYLRTPAIEAAR